MGALSRSGLYCEAGEQQGECYAHTDVMACAHRGMPLLVSLLTYRTKVLLEEISQPVT